VSVSQSSSRRACAALAPAGRHFCLTVPRAMWF
jgi:hypothetical protein